MPPRPTLYLSLFKSKGRHNEPLQASSEMVEGSQWKILQIWLFSTLTHRQLDWSTMMFIESPFLGYPTCLIFDHVVWWSTVLWTATPWLFRFPKEIFLYLNVFAGCLLFNNVVQRRYFPLCCRLFVLLLLPRSGSGRPS